MGMVEVPMLAEVAQEAPAVRGPRPLRSPRPAAAGPFRTVWRWHFYAGMIVTPFLVIVALTGALFIFEPEIMRAAHARLMTVPPGPASVGARAMVEAAVRDQPGQMPIVLALGHEPDRAAVVLFGNRERSIQVFVDPRTGRVLGSVDDSRDPVAILMRATLKLHRQLFLGTTGRIFVELATGWTVVLLVSGIYLWWPRRHEKVKGVWKVRWSGAKPYTRLRDLHSVSGAYLMPVALVIAVTGHFYTLGWGTGARYAMGAVPPASKAKPAAGGQAPAPAKVAEIPPGLDRIVAETRALYPDRVIRVPLAATPDRFAPELGKTVAATAMNRYESGAYGPIRGALVTCRPEDGSVISHRSMAEKTDRWVQSWAYPLHVGSIAGLPSKLIWLAACLVLAALPVTGVWMWWQRRPKGRLGLPRRPEAAIPAWLGATVTALSLFYPAVGLSALLLVSCEFAWTRSARLLARRRGIGAASA
ncbi:PepSY-associated TM helix domain-containing protein [Tundrisphaera sp. TA3]|uniref:PepSY-associated TM helix domain-containing protein n=1 Tax=Tundrisphaera sp. TA3 TaxID=3435775 RepID=UPI003EBC55E2